MKANEFRIGNYVFSEFSEDTIHLSALLESQDLRIKPIILTEEWLTIFGFNCRIDENEYTFSDGCEFTLGNHKHEENVWWFLYQLKMDGSANFRYVHELQNLFFALTGEELTTKK